MMEAAQEAIAEVDAVLFLVDGPSGAGRGDRHVAEKLAKATTPVLLVVNKLDAVPREERGTDRRQFPSARLVRVGAWDLCADGRRSASTSASLKTSYPSGPKYYPDDWVSDHPGTVCRGRVGPREVLHLTEEDAPRDRRRSGTDGAGRGTWTSSTSTPRFTWNESRKRAS